MEQNTITTVSSEEFTEFLSDREQPILQNNKFDGSIRILEKIFDFSQISDLGNPRKEKMLEKLKGTNLCFDKCMFTGSLIIRECIFDYISFKNCHFTDINFGVKPSGISSVEIISSNAKRINFEDSFFKSRIEIYKGEIGSIDFNYVTCPSLELQCMNNEKTKLNINRFLGNNISLPTDTSFETLEVDHLSFPILQGSTRNHTVYLAK